MTLSLEYNLVTRVVSKSVKRDISGTVKAITLADMTSLTIVDDSGKEHVINITRDTLIRENRKRIEATDIRPNYYLDIEVENDEAISIEVTVKKTQETIRGTVANINDKVKVMVVYVKDSGDAKTEHHVYYSSDTIIYKDNREVRISRIEEDDEVICIGRYDSGLFFADTIHDITISD